MAGQVITEIIACILEILLQLCLLKIGIISNAFLLSERLPSLKMSLKTSELIETFLYCAVENNFRTKYKLNSTMIKFTPVMINEQDIY